MNTPYHSKALPQGTILREWELEQVLGVGGFGIVYRGKGVYFGELVAIKEYFPGAISDRQDGTTVTPTDSSAEETYDLGLQKFVEEAKVLWNLSKPDRHPNIVSVRSLFEIHGTAYMVMDFETGVSLSQALRDGRRFDEAGLLGVIRPIAEGLDRAHRAGVLHRDIKPANILIDDSGRPVLIDFGSARFESGQATSTKVTFYTPPYAAIEQYVKTYPQGPWTDIYALGVTLYQCVTGEKPPEVLERLHGGLGEALSARERPGFSSAFTRAVDAAMAIRPAERPQSIPEWLKLFDAPDFGDDDEATRIIISAPAAAPPSASPPPSSVVGPDLRAEVDAEPEESRRKPPWLIIGGGVAAVLATCAVVLLLLPSHSSPPPSIVEPGAAQASGPAHATTIAPPSPSAQGYAQAADGLISDAQHAGRPSAEIGAMTDARAKLAAAAAQVQALAGTPGAAAKTAPLITALNSQATDLAHAEAAALERAATSQWRDVQHTLGKAASGDAANAIGAMRQARATLEAAVAAVSQAGDGIAAIGAARKVLPAYSSFANAYAAATRYFVPAKRAEIAALETSASAVSGQIVSLASGSKPWLLASQARKQAYQQLQTNAASAKSLSAELEQVSQSAGSTTDLRQLDADLTRATALKGELTQYYAASYAASHVQ